MANLPRFLRLTPLAPTAIRIATITCAALSIVAIIAAGVRLLPWLFDPDVPFRVALPFIRSIVELAVEAAVLVGWPVGWSLAAQRFAGRGEARAIMLLGEAPSVTVRKLAASAVPFACVLAIAAYAGGRDAAAPGRVATDLIAQGKRACARVKQPDTYVVPFVNATWLCTPNRSPRLYGRGPGSLGAVTYTARDAVIAGDMRRIDLDDARMSIPFSGTTTDVHVDHLVLRGLSPWAASSILSPWERALVAVLSALLSSAMAAYACLRRLAKGTFGAVLIGAIGPLAVLGMHRAFDRADASRPAYLLLPVVGLAATALGAFTYGYLLRRIRAATSS